MANSLKIIDTQTLMETPLEKQPWIIKYFLSVGLHLLVGVSKVENSSLVLSLPLAVSKRLPFRGFATMRSGVLYPCLEGTYHRLQTRLFRFTNKTRGNFYLCVQSSKLADDLIKQHQDNFYAYIIVLIIDGTFQVIGQPSLDSAYPGDDGVIGLLEDLADDRRIAILLIHHTRKIEDSVVFNSVSRTTGLTAIVDTSMVLTKEMQCGNNAKLTITERDFELREYKHLCLWKLVEKMSTEEPTNLKLASCVIHAHCVINIIDLDTERKFTLSKSKVRELYNFLQRIGSDLGLSIQSDYKQGERPRSRQVRKRSLAERQKGLRDAQSRKALVKYMALQALFISTTPAEFAQCPGRADVDAIVERRRIYPADQDNPARPCHENKLDRALSSKSMSELLGRKQDASFTQ